MFEAKGTPPQIQHIKKKELEQAQQLSTAVQPLLKVEVTEKFPFKGTSLLIQNASDMFLNSSLSQVSFYAMTVCR